MHYNPQQPTPAPGNNSHQSPFVAALLSIQQREATEEAHRQQNYKLWFWLLIILSLASLGSFLLAPHLIPGL
ncbi:hypothetical protein [Ktedonospora formicarum]|uniref:Uncharacterized protein n=1 Tax=Ktedonospora formicarum TaxID=2778364 RepID=A0A8J3MRY6_9CHLR|nr:hypothetical protein [Ktedonospora formicarum]GHO42785.1 hypothetical protein KSX_09480 [Ktedonospora formicarum]